MEDPLAQAAAVWQVRLGPEGPAFAAPAQHTVLRAAEAAGLQLPASCRNGTCRTCMQLLLQGQVAWTVDWPGLLAEEKREGWILPCVACARSDLVLQAPAAG